MMVRCTLNRSDCSATVNFSSSSNATYNHRFQVGLPKELKKRMHTLYTLSVRWQVLCSNNVLMMVRRWKLQKARYFSSLSLQSQSSYFPVTIKSLYLPHFAGQISHKNITFRKHSLDCIQLLIKGLLRLRIGS